MNDKPVLPAVGDRLERGVGCRVRKRAIFLDSFCGALAELPPGRRTVAEGLQALTRDPRVCTFERGAPWLERLIRELVNDGLVAEDNSEPYPWHRFNLTDAGREMLAGLNNPAALSLTPNVGIEPHLPAQEER